MCAGAGAGAGADPALLYLLGACTVAIEDRSWTWLLAGRTRRRASAIIADDLAARGAL
jgi:hypothetical protein